MSKPGPKPTNLRVLKSRGSPKAKLRAGKEPIATGGLECPPYIKTDAEKKAWRWIKRNLEALGIVGRIDSPLVGRYIRYSIEWYRLDDQVREYGSVYTSTERGKERPMLRGMPQYRQWMALGMLLHRLEAELGMSPGSRASLGAELGRQVTPEMSKKGRFFAHLDGV